jgi:hypothetical protein
MSSQEDIRRRSSDDYRKLVNVYEGWNKSARKKDFEECERQERIIKQIHGKHGVNET